jgi:purine nucleosidase
MQTVRKASLRLVIDTDTGSDDAVALLMAACRPGVVIEAVTTVAGNVDLDQATRNALYTLELASADHVPVYRGCERPLVHAHESAQHVHGSDGMGNTNLRPPQGAARDLHGIDALLELSQSSPFRKLTLVTLGPLTNIAAALIRDREFLERFQHVYCMAGAADMIGNIAPSAEYNAWADPEAAAILLSAATPQRVTMVGWDVSRQDAVMTPSDQLRLRELATPLALFVDDINQTVNAWTEQVTGLPGYDLPDPIAMAIALNPGIVARSERATVTIGLGAEVRGQFIIDRRHLAQPPNVTVVRRADGKRFRQMLFDTCRSVNSATSS